MSGKSFREKQYMWSEVFKGKAPHHSKVISIASGVTIPIRTSRFHYKKNYPVGWNAELRQYIKTRDGFICQVCNLNSTLHIHHIDYNKNNLKESNLITLCKPCHNKTNRHRQAWYRYLYELIRIRHPHYKNDPL